VAFSSQAVSSSQANGGSELWVSDLSTGQASKVLPGVAIVYFAVSPDDKQVVYETVDANQQHHPCLSSTEHRFAPREVRSASRQFRPQYSRSGRFYYSVSESGPSFLYRMNNDGTREEKVSPEPIDYAFSISPDERFALVRRTLNSEDNWVDAEAVPLSGGPWVRLCSGWCQADWSRDGKVMYFYTMSFTGNARTYVVLLPHGSDLPKLPASGFQSEKEL
jgi:hypothetical protein